MQSEGGRGTPQPLLLYKQGMQSGRGGGTPRPGRGCRVGGEGHSTAPTIQVGDAEWGGHSTFPSV